MDYIIIWNSNFLKDNVIIKNMKFYSKNEIKLTELKRLWRESIRKK